MDWCQTTEMSQELCPRTVFYDFLSFSQWMDKDKDGMIMAAKCLLNTI